MIMIMIILIMIIIIIKIIIIIIIITITIIIIMIIMIKKNKIIIIIIIIRIKYFLLNYPNIGLFYERRKSVSLLYRRVQTQNWFTRSRSCMWLYDNDDSLLLRKLNDLLCVPIICVDTSRKRNERNSLSKTVVAMFPQRPKCVC